MIRLRRQLPASITCTLWKFRAVGPIHGALASSPVLRALRPSLATLQCSGRDRVSTVRVGPCSPLPPTSFPTPVLTHSPKVTESPQVHTLFWGCGLLAPWCVGALLILTACPLLSLLSLITVFLGGSK